MRPPNSDHFESSLILQATFPFRRISPQLSEGYDFLGTDSDHSRSLSKAGASCKPDFSFLYCPPLHTPRNEWGLKPGPSAWSSVFEPAEHIQREPWCSVESAGSWDSQFSFYILKVKRREKKNRVTNCKFSLFCKVWGCSFPSSIQTMQLSS